MGWIIAVAVFLIVGFLLDREVYFYEGAHLGPRVQAWLYDRWSKKYDEGKRASQLRDDEMLARPLIEALRAVPEPFVLDFATGTGRLSLALLSRPEFQGHIIALDLSRGMLEQAAAKFDLHTERDPADKELLVPGQKGSVELLRHQSLPLPFPDETFDAVCALEVLELFPTMDEPLHELARVLRGGGVLLTSRGTEQSGRKAKVKSETEFRSILERHDFKNIQIDRWWKLFDRVIAVKKGSSEPVAVRTLASTLRCAVCGHAQWQAASTSLRCMHCGNHVSITEQRIVLA